MLLAILAHGRHEAAPTYRQAFKHLERWVDSLAWQPWPSLPLQACEGWLCAPIVCKTAGAVSQYAPRGCVDSTSGYQDASNLRAVSPPS